tara:strand:+ start:1240 stop:1551 length:312 start_codon:yes stop_codon:yes gene_type:complete
MGSNKYISEESLELMHILEKNPHLTQRQLSKEIGSSIGKVNYCLKGLIDIGFIKMENFKNSNKKINYAYIITPEGVKQKINVTKKFIKIKLQEYEKLNQYLDE